MKLLTSSDRAYLRGMANGIDTIFQIGKDGIGDNFITQIISALEARELIKIRLLETCEYTPKQAAEMICAKTGAQSVQIIGRKVVFYKQAEKQENRHITLPR